MKGRRRPAEHQYGPGPEQVGDLHLPDGDGPFPVAVVIHGGFWKTAYDRHLMDDMCADLVRRRWAAWNIEYRRVGGGGEWPAPGEDVAAAVDQLATLGADAGLDLTRVVAIGHSAGGHLALWLASRQRPVVSVTAVIGLAAVSDLRRADQMGLGGGAVAALLDRAGADQDAVMNDASPFEHLPLGAPTVLIHGDADDIVPVEISRRFQQVAAEAGDDCYLVEVAGQGHFECLTPGTPSWEVAAIWLGKLRPVGRS